MGALSEALCTMEVFLSLLLLSGWMAQETFCKCLKNKTEISTEPSEGTGLPPSDCTSEGKQIISHLHALMMLIILTACGRNPLSSQGTRAMAMRTGLEQQMQMLLSMDGSRAGRTTT